MTKEQLDKVQAMGKQLQDLLPDMYGSVKFNLKPGRESVNVNFQTIVVEESKILTNRSKT